MTHTCNLHTQDRTWLPVPRKVLRQEDCKVKASLGYVAKPFLKKKRKENHRLVLTSAHKHAHVEA